MSNDETPGSQAGKAGSFGSLFSHDDEGAPVEVAPASRPSKDEAGPGRPLEMRFSGDGDSREGRTDT